MPDVNKCTGHKIVLISTNCKYKPTFFLAECAEEDCVTNTEDPWNWTLQCLIAVGSVSLICLLVGTIFIKIAKYREKTYGYQPI